MARDTLVAARVCNVTVIPLATSADAKRLTGEWAGDEDGHRGVVHEIFRAQASRRPDAAAVRFGGDQLSYGELDRRANKLAHHLIAGGARPGDAIALYLERSLDMIVALLAILKSGGAYLALDPRYPVERANTTVDDAGVSILVTVGRHAGRLPSGPAVVYLDTDRDAIAGRPAGDPAVLTSPDAAAYIAYTSGSTGAPKGAAVPHRGVTRLVVDPDYLTIAEDDVFLQFAPLAFDASTLELWGPLLNGGLLVVHPEEEPSLRELAATIRDEGVTVLWLTSGLFHQMVEGPIEELAGLRVLFAGGDVLSPSHVNRTLAALPRVRLVNAYGPTENTTFTCCQSIADPIEGPVPIGHSIRGTRMYVLDTGLRPVPVGVPGELYTGGPGVAVGYVNRRRQTAERFLPDPYTSVPGQRMYRTGDLVRWRTDGALDFLGRSDKQLKIRGFRIEPGEIEAVLTQSDTVDDAVVVGQSTPGGKVLAAFVVPAGEAVVSVLDLRRRLGERLPEYSVPGSIVLLDRLPLNANGKVDRAALESRRSRDRPSGVDATYRRAEDPVSRSIAALWSSQLGIADVGVDDDFFQLGGDSLFAVRVIEEIKSQYGVDVTLRQLYSDPTVAALAAHIRLASA